MNVISSLITSVSQVLIRLFPVAVILCVLYFPFFKSVMLGYVPVGAGIILALVVMSKRAAIEEALSLCSRQSINVWLFALPAAVQLVFVLSAQTIPVFDGAMVIQHAQNFLTTGNLDPLTYYPPAQTLWYSFWFSLADSSSISAQLSHIPLSIGVTWFSYALAKDVLPQRGARFTALIVAWYPTFLAYVLTTPYYHYLYTLFIVSTVWCALRYARNNFHTMNLPWMFLAGIATGLGILTKGTQLIGPLQILVWIVVLSALKKSFPFKRILAGIAVFVVAVLTVLSPWVVRNWVIFEELVPVCTSGGLVFYSGNNEFSNGLYSHIPDDVNLKTPNDMLEHSKRSTELAKDFIKNNPRKFAEMSGFKFLHTWGIEATFVELINHREKPPLLLRDALTFIFLIGWSAVVMLWVSQSIKLIKNRQPLTPFEILVGVIILSNALVYAVFEGGDRHHLPFVPLIIIGAFASLHRIDDLKKAEK